MKKVATLTIVLLFLLVACKSNTVNNTSDYIEANKQLEISSLNEYTNNLSIWSTYWDYDDNFEVIKNTNTYLNNVCLFAVYFIDGALTIPEATLEMINNIKSDESLNDIKIYLTIVNDVVDGDKTTQKDIEILKELFSSDESINNHVNELIKLAKDNDFDGIEIDYEKIRSDLDLWGGFIKFEEKLIKEAKNNNLLVKIVLEPSTPMDDINLPQDVEYVVMCYNLYGGGTEPGPKANYEFLEEMYNKFSKLDNLTFAFSNNGYIWEGNTTNATQIKSSEIDSIISEYNCQPVRDENSGALYFTYKKDDIEYTIWYADSKTIALWSKYINNLSNDDVGLALWRI